MLYELITMYIPHVFYILYLFYYQKGLKIQKY